MKIHTVKVYPSKIKLSKKNQLAWKLAEISSDNVKLNKNSVEMATRAIETQPSIKAFYQRGQANAKLKKYKC